MATDEELRARIIEAAADLFAQYGFSGTKVNMVAKAARVSSQTVRRLTGGRADLFEQVMMARVSSSVAEKFATAVENPEGRPAIAVMLAAAQEVFTSPEASWGLLELEALTRAHTDDTLHEIEKGRIDRRRENAAALVARIRANGGLDADLSDTAIVHLVLAMSVGLAMLDPVLDVKPTMANWIMLIARIGTAMAPQDMLLSPAFDAGQPWRLRVDVPDQPGGVARLVRALGSLHAYTVAMQVVDASEGYRTIDVALIAPEGVTPEVMRAMAHSVGKHAYVGPGSLDDAIDLPTRVLDGATQLVTTPELAPFAAAKLVEADNVEVAAATEGEDDSPDIMRLQWTPDRHVVLQRGWAPFARAERTRASALLRLSSAIASSAGNHEAAAWVEPIKGGTVWIRLARPEDADAVAAMHDRSSERSRYQRYFSIADWRGTRLYRLAGGHRGVTLVVMSETGSIVGLGNVFPDAEFGEHSAEIALIVEDEYQQRGVGRKLLQAMLHMATRLGFTEVVASVLADNNGMLHLFKTTDLQWDTTVHDGVAYMRAPLPTVPVKVTVERRRSPRRKVDAGAEDAPAPGKETPAKKSPAKKAAPRKAAAKKAAPRKAAAKKGARKAPAKKTTKQSPSGKSPSGESSSSSDQ
jgi:AcrR family transcriptional regulator/L-amino acid N-acyltransferase YncA